MNFAKYLPPGFTIEDAIALLAAAAAMFAMLAVWQTLLVRDPMRGRLKLLQMQRDGMRADLLASRKRRPVAGLSPESMGLLLKRLNMLRSEKAEAATLKLAQAGFRSRDALILFLFLKLSLPLVFGVFTAICTFGLKMGHLPAAAAIGVSCLAGLLGWLAPDVYVKNTADKRRVVLQKAMPDGLDLLVICAEAGLSVDAALTRTSREIALSSPELADEFGLTAIELTFLPDRQKAFDNLALRTNLPSIRGMVNTLKQTEKYGTPLARSLRVLSAEFREERLLKAEEKAARLPATLTVPMMLFIFPTLFIVLVGPAALRLIDALSKGIAK